VSTFGYTGHVEFQLPAPFPAFSLGRYGKVPGQATLAPYAHIAGIGERFERCRAIDDPGPTDCVAASHTLPAFGVGYLLPFNLLRFDVARGVGRGGRWTFAVDLSREFWSIF
jgi:hypothetical protein